MNNDWQKMVHTRITYANYAVLVSMFLIYFVDLLKYVPISMGITFSDDYT